ncbi:hypothetical protein HSE3_gp003 [Bacillus phage vB_BceM-HSE3]|nr:hypothetical protein HSE3_gp003 [Bacillus phage vB_BceM-HSE3]
MNTSVQLTENGVEVQVTRKITIGSTFSISPSQAFMGIDAGSVEVIDICKYEDLQEEAKSDADAYLSTLEEFEDEYNQEKSSAWIVARYLDTEQFGTDKLAFPLHTFVDHISAF